MAIEEYDAALPFPPDRPSSLPTDRCATSIIDHEDVSRVFRVFQCWRSWASAQPIAVPLCGCQERQEAAQTTLPCMLTSATHMHVRTALQPLKTPLRSGLEVANAG